MFTPGLTNTPITKLSLIYIITSSIALSILDLKHLAGIHVSPHFWGYGQFWRAAVWQAAGFANSTETLFACVLIYHLRVIERAWGGRKLVSFLISTLPYTTLFPPILLALVLRPLSLNTINYLPSGPTATIFALLAQYHALIPHTYRYRLATSTSTSSPSTSPSPAPENETAGTEQNAKLSLTLLLSNKSPTYLIALQLSLSQFPTMLLPAVVGWFVGLAWRAEFLPGLNWRVPAWVVGEKEPITMARRSGGHGYGTEGSERYEDLRRRLEGEVAAASSSGMEGQGQGASGEGQRQRHGNGVLERLRGFF